MKTIDKTKLAVLTIGTLTVLVSLIGALKDLSLINYFFPLYAGLTLVGVSLLNRKESKNSTTDGVIS